MSDLDRLLDMDTNDTAEQDETHADDPFLSLANSNQTAKAKVFLFYDETNLRDTGHGVVYRQRLSKQE